MTTKRIENATDINVSAEQVSKYLMSLRNTTESLPGMMEGALVARFWEKNKELYPDLAQVARLVLHIPVVVTGCDSVFSAEAKLFNSRRGSLNFNNGMRQLAMKFNLRNRGQLMDIEDSDE